MSKIGILTYFNYYNYGSMLQGYATQIALRKYLNVKDSCLLINYRYTSAVRLSKVALFKLRLKRLPHYLTNLKEVIIKSRYASRLSVKNTLFDDFRDKYIETTDTFYRNKSDLQNASPVFDTYVIGSDQTWSPTVSGGYKETPMFLDYISDSHFKCAYAPSLGTSSFSEDDKIYLQNQIRKFDIISCRENDGIKLLQSLTVKRVTKVLDPTLLLTKEEWKKVAIYPELSSKGYILCYFIGHRDYYRNFAKQLSKQLNLPIFYIPVSWKDCKKDNNLLFDVGPREFIGLIDRANVVLTDSFHGTAFCCNLNSNFYSFIKHPGGKSSADNSRLFDLLSSLRLEYRLLENYNGELIKYSDIDFTLVNKFLAEERVKSNKVIEAIATLNTTNERNL